ncbi:MAG: M20 family metallopeptidase [Actinobacteria bacterium]|nr:M20 family metallopeptidase [Actinomycetota bacterium]MCL5408881.1 M20 family metallopeptidase [Candidatus Omnitrophota bacterium]
MIIDAKIIKQKVYHITKDIILWRRLFHQYPELAFEETKTSEKIQSILSQLKIPFEVKAKTGVVGFLKVKNAEKTIGIRADMDALPIKEKTGLSFSSKNNGIMHACGHDAHMATLLGTAKILSKFKDELKVNIKFIFQPSEEKPPGGAIKMIEEDVTKYVDNFIGFHYVPYIPLKKIWLGSGPVMANTDKFEIIIEGKGGHGSTPHYTKDPITCCSYLITQIQTIVSRRIQSYEPVVISIGGIHAGSAFNVIPDIVKIEGTVRTINDNIRIFVKNELKKIIEGTCKSFDCRWKLKYNVYSPSVINNPEFTNKIHLTTSKIFSSEVLVEQKPSMTGEDFAFFSRKAPSCYIFIGVGGKCGVLHSSTYILDESIIPFGVFYLSMLMFNTTSQNSS